MLDQATSLFESEYLDVAKAQFHTCLRPVSPDDVPVIGATQKYPNLFINAGHGSKGWTQCMGSAAIIASLVNGKSPEIDVAPFSPDRFQI
jgi:D-amino-acid dehydrogenase